MWGAVFISESVQLWCDDLNPGGQSLQGAASLSLGWSWVWHKCS